jgi:NADP-dependent alcohol dehydrogenase
VVENPKDYALASNFMWSTMALNGLIQKACLAIGQPMIGHELTAMYGIDHARTLAVIASLYKVMFETKKKSWHNTENVFSI